MRERWYGNEMGERQDIASEYANHMCDNRNPDLFYTDPSSFRSQQVWLKACRKRRSTSYTHCLVV